MPRRRDERPLAAPNLHSPTPDPGFVHPYGDSLASASTAEPDVDSPLWTCTHCGYQEQRRSARGQCPNCALHDSFVRHE